MATGSSSIVEFHPLPEDDPIRRRPDISLARRLLNWKPTVSLEEGIARTVAYFRAHPGGTRLDEPGPGRAVP